MKHDHTNIKIHLTESVSLATEATCALLSGRFPSWVNKRGDEFGHTFESIFVDNIRDLDGAELKKRLTDFAKSVSALNLHVMEISSTPGSRGSDSLERRTIAFVLGDKDNVPTVTILTFLCEVPKLGEDDAEGHIWKRWRIDPEVCFRCVQHPDKSYVNFDVVGICMDVAD